MFAEGVLHLELIIVVLVVPLGLGGFRRALLYFSLGLFFVVDLRAVDVEGFSADCVWTGGASLMIGTLVRRASAVMTAPRGALAAFLLARCPDTRVSGLQDAAWNLVDELVRVDELDAHLVERPLRVGPVLRHSVSGVGAAGHGAALVTVSTTDGAN